jgi:hypothetical protein
MENGLEQRSWRPAGGSRMSLVKLAQDVCKLQYLGGLLA